ncbi:MAG: hypothetical protein IPK12_23535 [Gemmatimonadetes bacterium]|nr:hypothetical protein [Gemmatimonadota bacterium]
MNRAARRRAAREAATTAPAQPPAGALPVPGEIRLANPMSENYAAFIVGNAQHCDRVVAEGTAAGQHLVLCGAGPSLAEHAAEWCGQGDQVWGCNSAAMWLHRQGHKVTHAFSVDQTPHMVVEWLDAPPLEYLVASSCHPHLIEHLLQHQRLVTFFHNFVGIPRPPVSWPDENGIERTEAYEYWLYQLLYPGTVVAGAGLNAVTRAIDVALTMGFERITVLGADCALRARRPCPPNVLLGTPEFTRWLTEDVIMHADGGNALASGATPITLSAPIDGRMWYTKPDMAMTALTLVEMVRVHGERIRLVGDTLPNALKDKPEEFLQRLPRLTDSTGKPIPAYTFAG